MSDKNDNDNVNSATQITNRIINQVSESDVSSDSINVSALLRSLDDGGFPLLILIFALFLVIPTPPPIATIAGLIIMFFAFQMMIGLEKIWLPEFLGEKNISRKILIFIVEKATTLLSKLERITRKRLVFFTGKIATRIIGGFIFILATITLTPIIFANSVPGLAIILISYGLTNKDGLIIVLGMIIGILSIFVICSLFIFGKALLLKIIDRIF